MSFQIVSDFRVKLANGTFSSREKGFLFIENRKLPAPKEKVPALQIDRHTDAIADLCDGNRSRCFWLVETGSDPTLSALKSCFVEYSQKGVSIAGYAAREKSEIERFWRLRVNIELTEPWNVESVWLMAGVNSMVPEPTQSGSGSSYKTWTAEHVLMHSGVLDCIFVQQGWFGYVGVRDTSTNRKILERSFDLGNAR